MMNIDVHRRSFPLPHRVRPRRRTVLSVWDRALRDFGIGWDLSAEERIALHATLNTPLPRPDSLMRALLAEAGGLALETAHPDLAAWCYAMCERIGGDDAMEPGSGRTLIESLDVALPSAVSAESLVWWCVRLVPRLPDEALETARRRTTACVLYLAVRATQAFASDDLDDRKRAGVLAALVVIIARRVRMEA